MRTAWLGTTLKLAFHSRRVGFTSPLSAPDEKLIVITFDEDMILGRIAARPVNEVKIFGTDDFSSPS